ncbi:M48 family metalloprotease [Microbispora bryophytorum]|uniref:M48 family metalloprotease n=1 Tax=Microbispora bryophytorum TaxID=1460882 RepID=UPI003717CA55
MNPGRANPFQLPSATTSLFVLLSTVTLIAASDAYQRVLGWLVGYTAYGQCATRADAQAPVTSAFTLSSTFSHCMEGVNTGRFVGSAATILVFVVIILAVHAVLPYAIVRRQGLHPLLRDRYPDIVAEIEEMTRQAGLKRTPELFVHPFRRAPGGRMFGCFGRYRLSVNLGLLNADKDEFLLVVRHELAHAVNRDIDLTYLTIASWWVFSLLIAGPAMIVLVISAPSQILSAGWSFAVMLMVLWLLRAAVIRSREHYADVRASIGTEPVTSAPGEMNPSGLLRRLIWTLVTGFSLHPTPYARAMTIEDPGRLLRAGVSEPFAAGLVVGMGINHMALLGLLITRAELQDYGPLLAGIFYGGLVAWSVGTYVWRHTLHSLQMGRPLTTGALPGLALAVGILAGEMFIPDVHSDVDVPSVVAPSVLAGWLLITALAVGCVLLVRWAVASAAAWLPSATGPSLARCFIAWQVCATLLFGTWLSKWLSATSNAGPGGLGRSALDLIGSVADHPFRMFAVVAWVFPLASWVTRAQGTLPVRQAYLGDWPALPLPRPRLRISAALWPVLVPVVFAIILDIVADGNTLNFFLSQVTSPYPEESRQLAILLFYVAAGIFQGATALFVYLRHSSGDGAPTATAHALFSAFCTGVAITVINLAPEVVRTCWQDPAGCDVRTTVSQAAALLGGATGGGLVAALGAVALAAVVRGAIRKALSRSLAWPVGAAPAMADPFVPPWRRRSAVFPVVLLVAVPFLASAYFWIIDVQLARPALPPATPAISAAQLPAATMSAESACAAVGPSLNWTGFTTLRDPAIAIARTIVFADSPALRAFGLALSNSIVADDDAGMVMTASDIQGYCGWVASTAH